jgi:hypothetical protein
LMVIPLVAAGVPLAPQAKKPTLYVETRLSAAAWAKSS